MAKTEVFKVGDWVIVKHYAGVWRVTGRKPEEGPPFVYTIEDADGDTLNGITAGGLTRTRPPSKR